MDRERILSPENILGIFLFFISYFIAKLIDATYKLPIILFALIWLLLLSLIGLFYCLYLYFEDKNLKNYLNREKRFLLDIDAPGSLYLKVGDIIGENLFYIPREWGYYPNLTAQNTDISHHLIESINLEHSILILGEGGQGKTITLKKLFSELSDLYISNRTKKVPLYIQFQYFSDTLSRINNSNLVDELYNYLKFNPNNQFLCSKSFFKDKIRKKEIILLLDGFDEIQSIYDQENVNQSARNPIFNFHSYLSCRINFYEHYLVQSSIIEKYSEKIVILPLSTSSIENFIRLYFKRMYKNGTIEDLLNFIKSNIILLDLAQRPILLMMIIDVYSDPEQQQVLIKDTKFGLSTLYLDFTQKWLKKEAEKQDSKLSWNDKEKLITILAWEAYKANIPKKIPYKSPKYQKTSFNHDFILNSIRKANLQITKYSLDQICHDICFRTFLICNYQDLFYFNHKSFYEFYVADFIVNSFIEDADLASSSLEFSTPNEVASFINGLLSSNKLNQQERIKIEDNLKNVYKHNIGDEFDKQIIREHSAYYLTCLGTNSAIQFIKNQIDTESNELPRRGMMVGLITNTNDVEVLHQYLNLLDTDSEAARVNLWYQLAYYGDIPLENEVLDIRDFPYANTLRTLFLHLKNKKKMIHWCIDLATLRYFIITRGRDIIQQNIEYNEFLQKFLNDKNTDDINLNIEKNKLKEILYPEIITSEDS